MPPFSRYLCVVLLILIAWNEDSADAADEECDVQNLRKCISTLLNLVQNEFNQIRQTEGELNDLCLEVQKASSCLPNDLDSCMANHRSEVAQSEALFGFTNQVCNTANGRRAVYTKMTPCFQKHSKDYLSCADYATYDGEDLVEKTCSNMRRMLCVADTSKKHCEEPGEEFGKAIEFSLSKTYDETCSSAATERSHWILVFSLLVAVFLLSRHRD